MSQRSFPWPTHWSSVTGPQPRVLSTYQGVVAAEREGQNTLLRVPADDLRDGLGNARNETRVLQFANGRVILSVDLLELVVTVKLHLPAELCELLR